MGQALAVLLPLTGVNRKDLLKKAKGILKVGASLLFPADISSVVDQRQREERGARILP